MRLRTRPLVPAPKNGTRISEADLVEVVDVMHQLVVTAGREMREKSVSNGERVGPPMFTDEEIKANLMRSLRSELAPLLWEGDDA